MARHLLQFEPEFDFELVGIACHSKDYRLCWFLNDQLHLSLKRRRELVEIPQAKQRLHSVHSLYEYHDEGAKVKYELLANRSEQGYAVPEEKPADYLLLLHNNQMLSLKNLVLQIRNIPMVLAAYEIDPDNLPSKENLLL